MVYNTGGYLQPLLTKSHMAAKSSLVLCYKSMSRKEITGQGFRETRGRVKRDWSSENRNLIRCSCFMWQFNMSSFHPHQFEMTVAEDLQDSDTVL